jgi:hypothetical protein
MDADDLVSVSRVEVSLDGVSIKGTFFALAEGEVEDVVVLVLTLPFVEAAAVPVESKKLGPDMKGSM